MSKGKLNAKNSKRLARIRKVAKGWLKLISKMPGKEENGLLKV